MNRVTIVTYNCTVMIWIPDTQNPINQNTKKLGCPVLEWLLKSHYLFDLSNIGNSVNALFVLFRSVFWAIIQHKQLGSVRYSNDSTIPKPDAMVPFSNGIWKANFGESGSWLETRRQGEALGSVAVAESSPRQCMPEWITRLDYSQVELSWQSE